MLDDGAAMRHLLPSLERVFPDHGLQIVHVVEIDVGQVLRRRIHVPRHGEINQDQRALVPGRHHPLDVRAGQEQVAAARGAHDDVAGDQRRLAFLPRTRDAADPFGDLAGAGPGTIDHPQRLRFAFGQVARTHLSDLARAEDEDLAAVQPFPKDFAGQLHGHAAHRSRAASDVRAGANLFGRVQRRLEKTICP